MYGCFDAYVVFGITDYDSERRVCENFLQEFKILQFAGEVVRNYAGFFVYGVRCKMDKTTGLLIIDDKEKVKVVAAHNSVSHMKTSSGKPQYHLGYFTAVTGDYETDIFTEYDPREKPNLGEVSDVDEKKGSRKSKPVTSSSSTKKTIPAAIVVSVTTRTSTSAAQAIAKPKTKRKRGQSD